MSFYEVLTLTVSFSAVVAVAISVWMLQRQLRLMGEQTSQLGHTLQLSAESALDTLLMFVSEAYLSYPELRPIFNEDEACGEVRVDDSFVRHRASALAETLADVMERALKFQTSGVSEWPATALEPWIRDSFRRSTFYREWLDQHRNWYSPSLLVIRDEMQGELTRASSPHELSPPAPYEA
jgi:hypothetical protein